MVQKAAYHRDALTSSQRATIKTGNNPLVQKWYYRWLALNSAQADNSNTLNSKPHSSGGEKKSNIHLKCFSMTNYRK